MSGRFYLIFDFTKMYVFVTFRLIFEWFSKHVLCIPTLQQHLQFQLGISSNSISEQKQITSTARPLKLIKLVAVQCEVQIKWGASQGVEGFLSKHSAFDNARYLYYNTSLLSTHNHLPTSAALLHSKQWELHWKRLSKLIFKKFG